MTTSNDTTVPEGYKRCSSGKNCKHPDGPILLRTEFGKNSSKKDKLHSECKMCVQIYLKKYQADHQSKIAQQRHKYYIDHQRELQLKQLKYDSANRQRNATRQCEYRKTHQIEIAIYGRTHKQQILFKGSRRRARKRGLPCIYTDTDFRRAKTYFNYRCAYCSSGPKETDRDWVLHHDHYIPLAAPNCPGTIPWNIVPACQTCNMNKGSKNPHDWLIERFGKCKAKRIEAKISVYFSRVKS